MTPRELIFNQSSPVSAMASAFQCWRASPVGVAEAERAEIALALAPMALFGDPRFARGALSDPAVAISLAYDHVWRAKLGGTRRDLILSALWLWAASGDLAASLALIKIKQRFGVRS